jgi:TonB-linked SusC/RagA family outer membrane protein
MLKKRMAASLPRWSKPMLLCLLVLLFTNISFAQQRITGTVTSANGEPVNGATVQVRGSNTATSTDAAGRFTIDAPSAATLVISSVGFTTQEVAVDGRSTIALSLEDADQSMNEVVVTALGIRREQRRLGYATTTVKPEELTINRTTNPMNALQGKVAGVQISAPSTGPGGSSKIRIRGQFSISGGNSPLIVINGIPVDNTNFGANIGLNANSSDNQNRGPGGVNKGGVSSDAGDAFQSINPDDIESMTVLKGAPAAALYGYRAAGGVIMITTKTRSAGKGIGVSYNLNYSNEAPLDFTDYQYEYGQGEYGVRPTTRNPNTGQWSFGEKFQPGMTQVLFDSVTVPYTPQRNRIKQFYRNAQNVTNTVSLSAGGEKGGLNLSLGNMESKGITPNNRYSRRTINLGYTYSLSDKLSFTGNVNYSNEYNKNPPNVGNQDNTIPVVLYNLANSMPLDVMDANKYDAQGNEYVYSRFRNRTNPYFVLAEQFNNTRRDRVFGNVALKYNILPWIYIQGRIGQDFYSRNQDYNNFPTGQASLGVAPQGFVNGVYTQEAMRFRELNTDVLVSATKQFGDFGVNLLAGGNQQRNRIDVNNVQVTDFVVRGLYTVMNGRAKDPVYNLAQTQVNSLYGSAEFSYKQVLYVNGTVRNDWFSVLTANNRSILYPSVTASYIFSENISSSWLSFGKFRIGYAEAGSSGGIGPYGNSLYYSINGTLFNGQPVGVISRATVPNANLVPMRIAEKEAGLEMRLFNNRVGIDFSVYEKITTDQIVTAQVSDASGFENTQINSGKSRNRGFELLLNLTPVERKSFTWNFSANTSFNKTKVLSILTDKPGESITVGTHAFNGELRQVVGQEIGQIAGFGYRRDTDGNILYDSKTGLPLRTPAPILFGTALPRWVGGFTNSFRIKGVTLSFLIDYKLGGKMLSGTNFNALRHGLHKRTLEGREGGVIGQGTSAEVLPDGTIKILGKNSTAAVPQDYWTIVRSQGLVEPVIYDAGFWKLRQVALGYDFSKYLPGRWPVKGVRLDLTANNVWLIKKWVDNIDPDGFGYTSDAVAGMESTSLPTTRSFGFNLNVRF